MFTHLMGLRLGPVLQAGEDAIIALNDPVFFDGQRLEFGGSDGHAETDLQHSTTYQRGKKNKTINNTAIPHLGKEETIQGQRLPP